MIATALLIVVAVWAPTPFVLERPGPTFDTTGEVDGKTVMSIDGTRTYPSETQLDFTTVYVVGGPESSPRILDTMYSWAAPTQAVLPLEVMYPPATTQEEISNSGTAAMDSSQDLAVAAALEHMGQDYTTTLTVHEVAPGSPSEGVLEPGDVLRTVNGEPITSLDGLRESLNDDEDARVDLMVDRDGQEKKLTAATEESEGNQQLGVYLEREFDFPFDVTFSIDGVGGPSAGMMLSLGVIDELTPGSLGGDRHIAGTGSIDVNGDVGAIGGIRQKLVGAADSGVDVFLAPVENCGEVVGHVPDGMDVVAVDTLEDSVDAVTAISEGTDPASLRTCSADS
ncbi:PDZ domain-containing protein [Kocuria sp. JC486]|uniref:YlbL family protein n=1 Tax=Kocuria sp. JC486 TaxID=1970736 RepID=UPI001424519E|nr:S16 family serine protease [Kocuria sp. JC486]NHU84457.1 PDZ domain-containing protein [Kocuria sp. JC486]